MGSLARRLPGTPPVLPGYTHVRALGTGGFADVFLYEQALPRRTIAVKVLLTDAIPGDLRTAFLQETNTLAHLATHPHVLTMYEAGIAADGRPYLVTEFCPTGYGDRFRNERIPVDEVIATGIGIGAALETAHAAGVLHRDIKPANILMTSFGRPVLADFGIAATLSRIHQEDQDSVGLSVPWAAPEMLEGSSPGSVESEVWSFGATLFALLAGRSPFEKPGGPNDRRALARRIMGHSGPAPLDRPDAPRELLRLISDCLNKNPKKRPASILEVLQRLQLAESEMGLRPSRLELAPSLQAPFASDGTSAASQGIAGTSSGRLGGLSSAHGVDETTGRPRRRRTAASTSQFDDATQVRAGGFSQAQRAPGLGKRWQWITAAGVAVLVAALAVAAWINPWGAPGAQIAAVDASSSDGAVVFNWAPPEGGADAYEVRVEGRPAVQQEGLSYTVETTKPGQRVCVTVAVVKSGKTAEASAPRCARSKEGQ